MLTLKHFKQKLDNHFQTQYSDVQSNSYFYKYSLQIKHYQISLISAPIHLISYKMPLNYIISKEIISHSNGYPRIENFQNESYFFLSFFIFQCNSFS